MGEVVAEARLLDRVAAGDDVEQEPAAREALEGLHLLGGQGGCEGSRPERDEELQPGRDLGEHRARDPGVLAPGAGRCQHGFVAEVVGGLRDLGSDRPASRVVAESAPSVTTSLRPAPRCRDAATVTGSGQIPVRMKSHPLDVPPRVLCGKVQPPATGLGLYVVPVAGTLISDSADATG